MVQKHSAVENTKNSRALYLLLAAFGLEEVQDGAPGLGAHVDDVARLRPDATLLSLPPKVDVLPEPTAHDPATHWCAQ